MDDHREGIQTEKPNPLGDHREDIQAEKPEPPWERPRCFRRDGEQRRGEMLWWLACASLIVGILALFPCWGWVPGLLGIPLGLCSRHLVKADLAKMQTGLMDPSGERVTASAEDLSSSGLLFCIVGTVIWGGLALFIRWFESL